MNRPAAHSYALSRWPCWLLFSLPCACQSPDQGPDSGADIGLYAGALPWDAEDFWTEPGPLSPIFGEPENVNASWALRLARSADGLDWVPDDEVIAVGFSSLGLLVVDGKVIVTGMLEGALGVKMDPSITYALVSKDGVIWGSHAWETHQMAHNHVVDPQLLIEPDGTLALVYFGVEFQEIPPSEYAGSHELRLARWEDDAFVESELLVAESGLLDPMLVEGAETDWLFATRDAQDVQVWRADAANAFQSALEWTDATVPFVLQGADSMVVYAQLEEGSRLARRGLADGAWLEVEEMEAPFDSCTSPVVWERAEGWLMLCAQLRPI